MRRKTGANKSINGWPAHAKLRFARSVCLAGPMSFIWRRRRHWRRIACSSLVWHFAWLRWRRQSRRDKSNCANSLTSITFARPTFSWRVGRLVVVVVVVVALLPPPGDPRGSLISMIKICSRLLTYLKASNVMQRRRPRPRRQCDTQQQCLSFEYLRQKWPTK